MLNSFPVYLLLINIIDVEIYIILIIEGRRKGEKETQHNPKKII